MRVATRAAVLALVDQLDGAAADPARVRYIARTLRHRLSRVRWHTRRRRRLDE